MQKKVLSATAFALLIGVSTFTIDVAIAQNGGEARSNDREMKKTLDDKHLTPIRPIRRVGDDNWPTAKDQPAPARETTGQSAKTDENKTEEKQQPVKQEAKQDAPRENASQDTAQKMTKPDPKLGNQAPPPDKPADILQDKATAKAEAEEKA